MTRILTIIVSYNFIKWIDKCLPSLINSAYPTDILVIDNNSSDDTVRALQSKYPEVRLIANRHNLGFGQANNIGMRLAIEENYDAVFLLNQDAWVDVKTIGRLVKMSTQHCEYGILSPIHLIGDRSKIDGGFATYTELTDLSMLPTDDIISVPFINAAVWYIPVQVIQKVGMFAPLFYHYGEDKDYSNRILYYGYKIGYLPNAFACHDRAFRTMQRKDFIRMERVYHLSEYANINYSFGKAFALGVLALVKKSIKALIHGKFSNFVMYFRLTFELLSKTAQVYNSRSQFVQNNEKD
jgi:GT2 family glycosyltransferase